MKPRYHVTASLIVSGIVYTLTESPAMSISSFVAGVFIDIDHFIDYLCVFPSRLSVSHFFGTFSENKLKRVYVFFHAWELIPLLVIVSWSMNWDYCLLGVTIGILQHMFLDQMGNQASPLSYFLSWRLLKGFDFKRCFPRKFGGSRFFYGGGRR